LRWITGALRWPVGVDHLRILFGQFALDGRQQLVEQSLYP